MRAAGLTLCGFGLLAAALMAAAPRRASACGGNPCRAAWVLPSPGPVPVDQLRWLYNPPSSAAPTGDGSVGHPRLYLVRGTQREPVPLRVEYSTAALAYTLTPETTLSAGTELVLTAEGSHCEPDAGLEAAFSVTAPAALPASLGTLAITPGRASIAVSTRAGSCSVNVDAAYVDLKLVRSEGVSALDNLIDYKLVLDGRPYEFQASLTGDRGALVPWEERVYLACTPMMHIDGVAPGQHTASMFGLLPRGAVLQTPEVSFELRCDPGVVLADASVPADAAPSDAQATALEGHRNDANEPRAEPEAVDAQAAALDAGARVDQARGENAEATAPDAEPSDCSVRPGSRSDPVWWVGVAALGWLAFRRRC